MEYIKEKDIMLLFGFEIKRKDDKPVDYNQEPTQKIFSIPQNDDGAVTIQSGSYYGTYVDLDGIVRNEIELITKYREMSLQPELETAIDEVINEAIVMEDSGHSVSINMDELEQPETIKKKIIEEFENVLRMLNFGNTGHEVFRRWYVDGRIFYHMVVDEANMASGIKEVRYIDPRRIRKVREIQKVKDSKTGIDIIKVQHEYYLYNERGIIGAHSNLGTKIAIDSIVNVNSGLMDAKRAMVLSYLHKAIKPLNQLRMIEDAAVIYRLSRAPERRIFYVDVGNMPTIKANQYLKDLASNYRNKLVYDSTTGEIKDDRKHLSMLEDFWLPRREGCFSLNTKIKLLDGRDIELGQLIVEHKLGKTNWVYSVSNDGKIVPGKISWAGVTRNNTEVIDIHLDNGEIITSTPDHKFILRNGNKIEAKDLQTGSSLMPLNTREHHITHNRNGKYLQYQDNKTGDWSFVHRMVSKYINGKQKMNEVVHHKDFSRWNNNPDNLELMDKVEHFKLHSKLGTRSWTNVNIEEHKKNLSDSLLKYYTTDAGIERKFQISEFNKSCENIWKGFEKGRHTIRIMREVDKKILTKKEYLNKWSKGLSLESSKKRALIYKNMVKEDKISLSSEEFDTKYSRGSREFNKRKYANKVQHFNLENISRIVETCIHGDINVKNSIIVSEIQKIIPEMTLKKLRKFLQYNGYNSITEYIHRNFGETCVSLKRNVSLSRKSNHTVVNIVYRSDKMDVGTLTIDENHEFHDYHNFALSSGIFVMNSKGTEIATLPGGANLGELEDVKYFEKKLYKSLGVPITRLESSQGFSLGRTTEITRDELKFSKFIQRIRNKFSTLFDDILRVQLVLKKICSAEEWEEFREKIWYDFKKDNNFTELKDAELLLNRITLLQLVDPYVGRYYSMEWIRKNILHLDEEEIEEIDKQMKIEQENAAQTPQLGPDGLPLPQQGVPPGGAPVPGQQQQQLGPDGLPLPTPVLMSASGEMLKSDGTPVTPPPSKFEVQDNEMEIAK